MAFVVLHTQVHNFLVIKIYTFYIIYTLNIKSLILIGVSNQNIYLSELTWTFENNLIQHAIVLFMP